MLTALRKDNQKAVNKAYRWDRKYHDQINLMSHIDDEEELEIMEEQAEYFFNRACDHWIALPGDELVNAQDQYNTIYGYDIC